MGNYQIRHQTLITGCVFPCNYHYLSHCRMLAKNGFDLTKFDREC